jgi:hypothetical protein
LAFDWNFDYDFDWNFDYDFDWNFDYDFDSNFDYDFDSNFDYDFDCCDATAERRDWIFGCPETCDVGHGK